MSAKRPQLKTTVYFLSQCTPLGTIIQFILFYKCSLFNPGYSCSSSITVDFTNLLIFFAIIPILLFQTSDISQTVQNTRFYFLEYHQIHLIIGRFQIFSPVPVPDLRKSILLGTPHYHNMIL